MTENFDDKSLRQVIDEQNALASIDIVYFLIVPLTFFLISQLRQIIENPATLMFTLLFFPGGLVSLPLGLYAKMVDSVVNRIRAWAVYALLSSMWFAEAFLLFMTRIFWPAVKLTLNGYSLWFTFTLGVATFGIAIGAAWIRWVESVFLKRVPTRSSEIEASLQVPILKSWILPRMKMRYMADFKLLCLGAVIYLVFVILSWLRMSGLPVP